jgi:hypothetical protein
MDCLLEVSLSEQFRTFPSKKLSHLYKSLNIARIVKSRRLRSAEHTAGIEEIVHKTFWSETHLEEQEEDGRITLRRTIGR